MTYRGPAAESGSASWETGRRDSIIYARSAPPVMWSQGNNPFGGVVSGANGVQRPNVVPVRPSTLTSRTRPAAGHQPSRLQHASRWRQSGTQPPSRASRDAVGLGRCPPVPLTERFRASDEGRLFNILTTQFRQPVTSSSLHSSGKRLDACGFSGEWGPERGLESSLSNWRTAFDPVRA